MVSIPEPEKFNTFTFGKYILESLSAALDKSSLITSEGQEPTRKSCFISGRLSNKFATSLSNSSWASAIPARSFSSNIAVPNLGSAKIITPAADCKR